MLLPVGFGGFPCLGVIVDLLGSAHIVVVVVLEKLCVCVFSSLTLPCVAELVETQTTTTTRQRRR